MLVMVPVGVVTMIWPLVAPLGTVAWIEVVLLTTKLALAPLNFTELAPFKLPPVIVTEVPIGPLVGEKPTINGGPLVTVKDNALVSLPPPLFVTVIVPLVAAFGTVATIWVADTEVIVALVPLNLTEFTPPRLTPIIVTAVPTGPLRGLKLTIAGEPICAMRTDG